MDCRREERVQKACSVDHHERGDARLSASAEPSLRPKMRLCAGRSGASCIAEARAPSPSLASPLEATASLQQQQLSDAPPALARGQAPPRAHLSSAWRGAQGEACTSNRVHYFSAWHMVRECGGCVGALVELLPCYMKLVTLRGGFPALFPSLAPQSNYVGNGCSCSLASFQPF